jgi:P-type Cu2+ transporter
MDGRATAAMGLTDVSDLTPYIRNEPDGERSLNMLVDGMHCAGCQNRIEKRLRRMPGLVVGRVNLTARRLALRWKPEEVRAETIRDAVEALGFRLVPYDPGKLSSANEAMRRALLRAMAVAGFAAANIMLLSVAVWAGNVQDMDPTTRSLMHWLSALIAIPAVAYAGRPFFRSALTALKARALNMDVPISLAVLLAMAVSMIETMQEAPDVYFDSATALLFFLLIGRFLEQSARGRARSAVEHLLALNATAVTVLCDDGVRRTLAPEAIGPGMRVFVPVGGRVPVDGRVVAGTSDIDTSLITGESVPRVASSGSRIYAGAVNLSGALTVEVAAAGQDTLLAEIARLLEAAEQRRARYVEIAARIVRIYAPAVHILAAATFLYWFLLGGAGWQTALLYAVAVLIVTCPCALALAVPVVQVVAANRLFRKGVLVKSGTALERLAAVDAIVLDKTGTVTVGRPDLVRDGAWTDADLQAAAALAASSLHPLARALAAAVPDVRPADAVEEVPGHGLLLKTPEGEVRLGRGGWAGGAPSGSAALDLWFARPGLPDIRFEMTDRLRPDAAETIRTLIAQGFSVELLSGDRASAVAPVAAALGIARWRADCTPSDKIARLEALAAEGRRPCMVGDGLNDAPALAAAAASISPSTAADISQTAADVVFQGEKLAPVVETIRVARMANRLVRQNFALAFGYNSITIPIAMAGLVTPLIAAVAMSTSSLVVIGNALRLGWQTRR